MRLLPATVVVLLGALALGGCAKSDALPVSQSYLELDLSVLDSEARVITDCVEERTGLVLRVTRGGYIEYTSDEVPLAQSDLVRDTIVACDQERGVRAPKENSVEMLEKFYAMQLDARNCLMNEGYSLPEPPSKTVFIDNFNSAELSWNVMIDFSTTYLLKEDELLDVLEKCPDPLLFYWR